MLFIFSTPELIRNLWQLKTAVFLHWCLFRALPIEHVKSNFYTLVRQISFMLRNLKKWFIYEKVERKSEIMLLK